jgi:outer membrane cobalamin receptor
MIGRFFLFQLFFFAGFIAEAQVDSITILNPVVVSLNRDSALLSSVNVALSSMQRNDIKKVNGRSLPEVLQEMPGTWIQKTSHAGGSPFIRGLTGNQVLELIDGIRLNNATFRYGPNQYLSTIDPYAVQQAEVLRNAYSTIYGSDAIGGVVNILTAEPAYSYGGPKFGGSMTLKGMTRDMEKTASGKLSWREKNFTWESIGTLSAFGDAVAADKKVQTPTSYGQNAIHSKIKFMISPQHEIHALYQYLRQNDVDLYDQVTRRNFAFNKIDRQERQLGYIRSKIRLNNKLIRSITTTASAHYSLENRSRQRNGSSVITSEQDKVLTYGLQLDLPMTFSARWNAYSGAEMYHDKVKSNAADSNANTSLVTPKRGLYADGSTMTSFSIFHQQNYHIGRWEFSAGLRLNLYDTKIPDPKFGDVKLSPTATAGNASSSYNLSKHTRITASINTAYRTPNINDLSSFGKFDFGVEVPSPDLKPERSINKEIMIHIRYDNISVGMAAFHNSLSDLIDRVKFSYEGDTVFQGDRVYTKENIGKAYIYGGELFFNTAKGKHWRLNGNVSYTFGQNKTADQPLRRIPPLFARLNLEYRMKRSFVILNWSGAGEQTRLAAGDIADHRIDPGGTPGFGLLSLRSGWEYRFINIEIGLENILDQSHRYHGSGIDGYGRHLWLRTTFNF